MLVCKNFGWGAKLESESKQFSGHKETGHLYQDFFYTMHVTANWRIKHCSLFSLHLPLTGFSPHSFLKCNLTDHCLERLLGFILSFSIL